MIIFALFIAGLEFTEVLIIKFYINYFQNRLNPTFNLYTLGAIFITTKILSVFLSRQLSMTQSIIGFKSSLELACFVFNKLLKVSPSGLKEKSSQGEIINFIQVDRFKVANMIQLSPSLLIIPIEIAVYILMLFYFFGFSFIFGLSVLMIFFIINYKIFAFYRIHQIEMLKKKIKGCNWLLKLSIRSKCLNYTTGKLNFKIEY